MAHWSSTGFNHYAAESNTHDLRNAKPRWQELAELAEIYSSSSPPIPTAKAPRTTLDLRSMNRQRSDRDNGDYKSWTRRSRARDGNVASLGASRSRSRSRPTRTRTVMTEEFVPRHRSESTQPRGSLSKLWKQAIIISLLALVLVWYGNPIFPDARTIKETMTEEVWTTKDGPLVQRAIYQICNIPLVPKVLDCSHSSGTKVSSNGSIHHAFRDMVPPLSENPDTVDTILDMTEDIKKELTTLQELETKTTQPADPAGAMQNEGSPAEPLCTDHLLNLTSALETNLIAWDIEKDNLLETMQKRLTSLNLEHQDTVKEHVHHTVTRDLRDFSASLENMQISNLDALNKTVALLLHDMPQCLDTLREGDARDILTTPQRPSLLKRLLLWSLPFRPTIPLNIISSPLTSAERRKILHDKVLAIRPLLDALHTSTAKAYSAATAAETMMMIHTSWLGSIGEPFWRGSREKVDKDILKGLKELKGLVPMIIAQRKGGRADRKYMRTMAKAKKAVEEIRAKKEGERKASRVRGSVRVWERRNGKMEEVVSEDFEAHDMDEKALEAHDKAMKERDQAMEKHDKAMEEGRKAGVSSRVFTSVQEFFD